MGTMLPGYGLPLEQKNGFAMAEDWHADPITVRERTMIAVMSALKDKPDWERKVFDDDIVAKWRDEAKSIGQTLAPSETELANPINRNGETIKFDGNARQKAVSIQMFDYCISELRDSATTSLKTGFTEAIDANAVVYMSDTAVTNDVKEALKEAVKPLEDVREELKDWHPGSDGKVLDLVHPSLFPLMYGRTRVLTHGKVPLLECSKWSGRGDVVAEVDVSIGYYSRNFQWLPCDVTLDPSGNARMTSYINNLHPACHPELYSVIETVIAKSVPLWSQTLLSTRHKPKSMRIEEVGDGWVPCIKDDEEDDHEEDEDEDEEDDIDMEETSTIMIPEPVQYHPRGRVYTDPAVLSGKTKTDEPGDPDKQAADIFSNLADTGLQVIVKLANIHLTPEKSTYDGGSWHVEGQSNEHICASALYYYDSENITDSYLAFREGVDKEILSNVPEQHRHEAIQEIYGIDDSWGSSYQVLGKVLTRENRLLVFPNVLHHRVSPFELADPTKPGHRKILALFLVDPHVRIPSTGNVPPQQRDWWAKVLDFGPLPPEIAELIVDGVDEFPIGMDEAKRIREDLIEERGTYVEDINSIWAEEGYCFCEH